MTSSLHELLSHFHPLRKESVERLISVCDSKSFRKNEIIVSPGEIQHELYFIKEGTQMSFLETPKKIHVIAFTYPPFPCALPDSFPNQNPTHYTLQCMTDSEMYALKHEQLNALLRDDRDLETTFRKMTEQILSGVIHRHAELHAATMEERFRNFCRRSPHLLHQIPHKYLASYLGIDATNFSKLFNSISF